MKAVAHLACVANYKETVTSLLCSKPSFLELARAAFARPCRVNAKPTSDCLGHRQAVRGVCMCDERYNLEDEGLKPRGNYLPKDSSIENVDRFVLVCKLDSCCVEYNMRAKVCH